VNYTFDSANRPKTATDGSNGITYATSPATPLAGCLANAVCYTPQGSIYSMSVGETSTFTGLNISETFNNRLEPIEIKASSTGGNALDITYNFVDPVSGKNAGHVYGITNNLDGTRSQSFTYDQLNRIAYGGTTVTSSPHCWGYNFTYDAWGNLLSQTGDSGHTGCSEPVMSPVTADGNNHISAFGYDAAGNALGDGTFTYSWDAESQLKTTAGLTYAYDGGGRRVSKTNGVASRLYWYGSGGEILAETDSAGNVTNEYIFFGGKRIADVPASSTPLYYVSDLLGSARVVTTNTGVVCYDADFSPYGGEGAWTSTCLERYRFEGKERDAETGNDDFGARYYSNRFGRWLSADWSNVPTPVPYASLTNPQTLNLYAMVSDDPESFADLDGHLLNFGRSVQSVDIDQACQNANWFCLPPAAYTEAKAQQQTQNQENQTGLQQGSLQPSFTPNNATVRENVLDLQSGGQITGTLTTSEQLKPGEWVVHVAIRQAERRTDYDGQHIHIQVKGEVVNVPNSNGSGKLTVITVIVTPLSPRQNFRYEGTGTLKFQVTKGPLNKPHSEFTGYQDVSIHFRPGTGVGHESTPLMGPTGATGDTFKVN
jgi:RHS repeat-associated protein